MALPDFNITTSLVRDYIGGSSNRISSLCNQAGLNKYSFYGVGQLDVNASKDVILTPPAMNFKLGDFRGYNQDAPMPSVTQGLIANWGPVGVAQVGVTLGVAPEEMNIRAFPNNGCDSTNYHVTVKIYPSATDRTNETNCLLTQVFTIPMNSHTPLAGHTRQANYKANPGANGNLLAVTGMPVATGDGYRYAELYISDISGNRMINLGTRVDGFSTISTHQKAYPRLTQSGNITPVPSGYTASWIEVTSDSLICGSQKNLTQTTGSSSFSFYARIKAVYGMGTRSIQQNSCTVTLTLNGVSQIVRSTPLSYSGDATQITGTLSGEKTWQHDDVAYITATASYPASPGYTQC
jgi:hypothetical protein